MADEVEIAKNALDVLSESSDLISAFAAVSRVLQIAPSFFSVVPFVGAVLGLIQSTLPDTKHEEILGRFQQLSVKIDHVRADIEDLEITIKWENVMLQYEDHIGRIESGMRYCLHMGKAKDKDSKMRSQQRLKDACAYQQFTLTVDSLMGGMIGSGLQKSIIDDFYEMTKGHRPKIAYLANRLLQLVGGGLMVSATCEAAVNGKKGAIEIMKQFEGRLLKVRDKIQSVLDSCVSNFEEHMLSDINSILDRNFLSNGARRSKLRALMKEKYDWQEHYCLVYDDLWDPKSNSFAGNRVGSLYRNGKCGIVFYRDADEPARFSDRYDAAYTIVKEANCYRGGLFSYESCNNAKDYNNIIKTKLDKRGISWTGIAVVKRSAKGRFGGNFATKVVRIVGTYDHVIVLLQ